MSIVKNYNGTEPGTDSEDMVKYSFNGSPNGLYEHEVMPEVGEYRVMTVTVECTSSGDKKNRDGKYPAATWAVREAALGKKVDPPAKPEKTKKDKDATPADDPNQPRLGEESPEYGDYTPPFADEPATEAGPGPDGPQFSN